MVPSEEDAERLEGGSPFEIRVLRGLAALNNWLTGLEEKVDARLRDTRPVWEAVLLRLGSIETRLDSMEARLEKMDERLEKVEDKFDVVAEKL